MSRSISGIGVVAFLAILLSFCVPEAKIVRQSRDLPAKFDKMRSYLIVPVGIGILKAGSDGEEYEDERLTETAVDNLVNALEFQMLDYQTTFIRLNEKGAPDAVRSKMKEIRARYDATEQAILEETVPGRRRFDRKKLDPFDYAIGSNFDRLGGPADALLFVRAFSLDRSKAIKRPSGGTPLSKGVFSGISREGQVNGSYLLDAGRGTHYAFLGISLIEWNTGKILWYGLEYSRGNRDYDLLDRFSVQKMVERAMARKDDLE